jgi:hypothetical protein
MGIILACKFSSTLSRMCYVVGLCALFGALGLMSTLLLDRFMYGFWAFPLLANIHFNVVQGKSGIDLSTGKGFF